MVIVMGFRRSFSRIKFGTGGGLNKSLSRIGVHSVMVVCFSSLSITKFGAASGLDRSLLCEGGMFQ